MSAPARGAATLHDVAREAGVSLATASRVLNGSTRKVAQSYRDRVEAVAERLGYTANISAQATARGTSASVAVFVADISDPYFAHLAAGVDRGAAEAGLVVTINVTHRDPRLEARLLRTMRGHRPRGVILAASRVDRTEPDPSDADLEVLANMGVQIVTLGREGRLGRTVVLDNAAGARALGARMASLGYREAVIVAIEPGTHTSDDRVAGFTEGFTEGGGRIREVRRGGFTRGDGYTAAHDLLAEGLEPGTLVFAISDIIALGVMAAVREAGREVGADIAVAGFDDLPLSGDIPPGLTTVRVPLDDLGYQAFQAVVQDPRSPADAPPLELDVVVRGSTPTRL